MVIRLYVYTCISRRLQPWWVCICVQASMLWLWGVWMSLIHTGSVCVCVCVPVICDKHQHSVCVSLWFVINSCPMCVSLRFCLKTARQCLLFFLILDLSLTPPWLTAYCLSVCWTECIYSSEVNIIMQMNMPNSSQNSTGFISQTDRLRQCQFDVLHNAKCDHLHLHFISGGDKCAFANHTELWLSA